MASISVTFHDKNIDEDPDPVWIEYSPRGVEEDRRAYFTLRMGFNFTLFIYPDRLEHLRYKISEALDGSRQLPGALAILNVDLKAVSE